MDKRPLTMNIAMSSLIGQRGATLSQVSGKNNHVLGLFKAAENGDTEEVERLLDTGAYVNSLDAYLYSPLHWACRNDHFETAKLLLHRGANVDVENKRGWTPLLWACFKGNLVMVDLLMERGANVNKADKYCFTPLHGACSYNHLDIAQKLIAMGAMVNATDNSMCTPLHVVCCYGYVGLAKELLQCGADSTLKNKDGKTPVDCITKNKDKLFIVFSQFDPNVEYEYNTFANFVSARPEPQGLSAKKIYQKKTSKLNILANSLKSVSFYGTSLLPSFKSGLDGSVSPRQGQTQAPVAPRQANNQNKCGFFKALLLPDSSDKPKSNSNISAIWSGDSSQVGTQETTWIQKSPRSLQASQESPIQQHNNVKNAELSQENKQMPNGPDPSIVDAPVASEKQGKEETEQDDEDSIAFYEPHTSSMEPVSEYAEEVNDKELLEPWSPCIADFLKSRPRSKVTFTPPVSLIPPNNSLVTTLSDRSLPTVKSSKSRLAVDTIEPHTTAVRHIPNRYSTSSILELISTLEPPSKAETQPSVQLKLSIECLPNAKKERAIIVEEQEDLAPPSCLNQALTSLSGDALLALDRLNCTVPQLEVLPMPNP